MTILIEIYTIAEDKIYVKLIKVLIVIIKLVKKSILEQYKEEVLGILLSDVIMKRTNQMNMIIC